MEPTRPGKAIGARLARALLAQFGGQRDPALEQTWPEGSRHQVFVLSDSRVVDVFLKSARLYDSADDFRRDRATPPAPKP